MHPDALVMVHQLGIERQSVTPPIYSAICRRCGLVVEKKTGPLTVGIHGLYGIRNFGTDHMEVFEVKTPLPETMQLCEGRMVAKPGA